MLSVQQTSSAAVSGMDKIKQSFVDKMKRSSESHHYSISTSNSTSKSLDCDETKY